MTHRRIPFILSTKRYPPHFDYAIPPIIKWHGGPVQTFKQSFKKLTQGTLKQRLSRLLFTYRLTPHSTTGRSPAELMLGRQPRSRLDLLKPNITQKVEQKQLNQKLTHDKSSVTRVFQEGEEVYSRNFSAQGP